MQIIAQLFASVFVTILQTYLAGSAWSGCGGGGKVGIVREIIQLVITMSNKQEEVPTKMREEFLYLLIKIIGVNWWFV